MGVPTRYKQPSAVFVSPSAAPLMQLSLARAAGLGGTVNENPKPASIATKETVRACYTFLFGDRAEDLLCHCMNTSA
jgi:hypothetical protein